MIRLVIGAMAGQAHAVSANGVERGRSAQVLDACVVRARTVFFLRVARRRGSFSRGGFSMS